MDYRIKRIILVVGMAHTNSLKLVVSNLIYFRIWQIYSMPVEIVEGTYFNCIMFMVASSVVLTVVVLNYHHRTADIHTMPPWIRAVFLDWLPWILRMGRPGKARQMKQNKRDLEMQQRSSRSLLSNIIGMEENERHTLHSSNSALGSFHRYGPSTIEDQGAHHTCQGVRFRAQELHNILIELQFITNRMRRADEDAELISDWKFAAMVVDRFCLIVFTLFTIIATVAVLLSAPHIIVQ